MPARQRKPVEVVPEQETEEQRRKRLLRKAYGDATSALRLAHQDEFLGLYRKHAEEAGVAYTPRPTAEQKASQEFEALIEAHPFLLDRLEALRDAQNSDESDEGSEGQEG